MDIYKLLQEIITTEKYRISPSSFAEDKKLLLDKSIDKELFELIKNISTLFLEVNENGAEFTPSFVFEGKRSFAVEDLTEDNYALLNSLAFEKLPLNIKARITDILWCCEKNYKIGIIAAEAYLDMFNQCFSDTNWIEAIKMVKRSICISVQIGLNDLHDKCCQTIYNHIIRINGTDKDFLSIKLIEIILKKPYGDSTKILDVLDNIIACHSDNPHKTEAAFHLKNKYLTKAKDTKSATQTNIDLANYFVDYAEKNLKNGASELLKMQPYLQKAIMLYRNNGETSKAETTHKKLIELQKNLPKLFKPFKVTFDGKVIRDNIIRNMSELSFEESIIRLAQMLSFYSKSDFKQKVLDDIQSFPLSHLFTKNIVNTDGQTVLTLPPLSASNPEQDPNILDMHIHNKMLEYQEIQGNMYFKTALSYITETFSIKKDSFDFIIHDNAIIPEGRENIIRSALLMVFQGEYYEALHILAPQVENIFRNIAKSAGALTITLENNGTSKEKVLSSIFDLPELCDCYDNDILFMFKGLLNEQAGANIRNNVAHGIIKEQQSSSGSSLFFICAVVKLLVISSKKCIKIMSNSSKLQSFIALPDDAIENVNFEKEE